MTPVILLTDGYIANGSEPWRIPKYADLPKSSQAPWRERRHFCPIVISGRASHARLDGRSAA
jgi:hypothetical protein